MNLPYLPLLIAACLFSSAFAGATEFDSIVRPYLEAHCIACHGPDKQKGRLRLDTLNSDFSDSQAANTWIEVRDNINLGEMPPEDEPRPESEKTIKVSRWIAGQLRAMQSLANSTFGRVQLRRLNRTEYTNTIKDLLKVTFEDGEGPESILPPDGTLDGFNKASKALLLDPSLMENYFDAARFVANRAIQVRPPRVKTVKGRYEFEMIPTTQGISYVAARRLVKIVDEGAVLFEDGVRTAGYPRHPYDTSQPIPVLGKYTVRVRAGADKGIRNEPVYMEIRFKTQKKRIRIDASMDRPQVYEWTETFSPNVGGEFQVYIVPGTRFSSTNMDTVEFRSQIGELTRTGDIKESIRLQAQAWAEGLNPVNQSLPTEESRAPESQPKLFVDYLEVEGPLQEEFPPQSTQYLYPDGYDNRVVQTSEEVRSIFSRVLPRAFRRPVSDEEISSQLEIVVAEMDRGKSFHDSMKLGLTAMLCSPDFLFITEPGVAEQRRDLNEFELASRLSYFLWSSMPDEELFDLARSKRLRSSLTSQVNRMLADSKADALVTDFADQWLKISEFDQFRPDEGIYRNTYYAPEYAGIAKDMEKEAREFFREILTKNESVFNFLDSDWLMINEKLASYYGIEGVTGAHFRRVDLPSGSPRGGIMGMGGVHKWGADGARTKPVERGKYLLTVLFNDPPDPPPPNAGEVEPNVQGERLTVRERLLRHQEVEACAGCHRTIDPYGLALENFNAIGQWRDVQDGEAQHFWTYQPPPIVSSGTLPNGTPFENFTEFKSAIRIQTDRLERGLAEKMMTYALGRSLESTDDPTIQDLVKMMGENGHTLGALIHGIVKTDAFQTK